jgi:starch synthase
MSGKAACKLALQRELGLPLAARTPLFTMVSRFVEQKGFDLLLVRVAFDDGLAHRLGAAGDFFLVPSRFEPCGLSQMYAMRYGTLPVVRATGGLADTVTDLASPDGTGIVFEPFTTDALRGAIDRAIAAYERNQLGPAQARGMARDFSWAKAAGEYEKLYQRLAA